MAEVDIKNPLIGETTCRSLLHQLQKIWDEVGEGDEERDKMLLQLEQECLDVYQRKVDQAEKSRAQLLQALADSKLEFSTLLASLGEKTFVGIPDNTSGTIKEQLAAIAPALEQLCKQKEERIKEFLDVQTHIQKICGEIAGGNQQGGSPTIDESDLRSHLMHLSIGTKYMPGGSLYEYLHKNHHTLTLPQLVEFAIDVCRGMEYLHQSNIMHRDLKTTNLLMDSDNVVKVADFGVDRFQNQEGVMTAETGTYRWMAPEVINQPYDQKADVFNFAIVLWELVTAKIPYDNMTPLQAALEVRQGRRPDLPTNTHPKLLELIQRCWNIDPSIRPSFSEVKVELEILLQEIQILPFIPDGILLKIVMMLPVKSLIRFRSASKSWKSLIDSSKFVADHTLISQTHLLIKSTDMDYRPKYVSIVDDNNFPQGKCVPILPFSSKIKRVSVVGTSHGLICFHVPRSESSVAVVWNPFIKKSVEVAVPKHVVYDDHCKIVTDVCFGVCPNTLDPKIVKFTSKLSLIASVRPEVEVLTLSSLTWRPPLCSSNINMFSFSSPDGQVVTGGCICWCANDAGYRIISFDLSSEELTSVVLPDSFSPRDNWVTITKLRESLAVCKRFMRSSERKYEVWMMKPGVVSSLTLLYTFKEPYIIDVLGFRMTDAPVIEIDAENLESALVVYDADLKHYSRIGVTGSYICNNPPFRVLILS